MANNPFAKDATTRGDIPAGKYKSGFAATQEPHEYANQAIYLAVTDHVWGTLAQTTAGDATFWTDGSGDPFDKDSVAVTFADDDKILIVHDVAATGNILLNGGSNRFFIEMLAGVTMDMSTFNLTIGESGDSFRGNINVTGTGTLTVEKPQDLLADPGSMTLVGVGGHFNGEVPDFESTNLIINVQSNTTVDADADRLSFLNAHNIATFNNNINETFTMPTDLMSGTSEKASTWYQMWLDSDGVQLLVPDIEGTTDSTTANKLEDSGEDFITDKVSIGDIVYNLTDLTQTTVTAIDDLNTLSLASDIFVSGEDYKIRMLSPTGLGAFKSRIGAAFNNGSSNFDDSTYTQIQEEKNYTEAAGDFTLTGTPTVTAVIEANVYVRQVNDWSGKGIWKVNFNTGHTVASGARTAGGAIFSGVVFKNVTNYNQTLSAAANVAANATQIICLPNTGQLAFSHSSATTLRYFFSGDLVCEKKPTFHN